MLYLQILVCSLFGAFHSAASLRCYGCSSIDDANCGLEWKFKGSEAEKFLIECHPSATACHKYVGELQGNGNQLIYRRCWNQTTVENYTPSGCEEQYITGSIICHCSRDRCNGSDAINLTWTCVMIFLLSTILVKTI